MIEYELILKSIVNTPYSLIIILSDSNLLGTIDVIWNVY
jgi:hypothetical protein